MNFTVGSALNVKFPKINKALAIEFTTEERD